MNCKNSEKLIMKYVDGELSEEEAKLLNGHITKCSECKAEFYFYDNMLKSFGNFEEVEAPETFEADVMAKITALGHNYSEVEYKVEHKVLGAVLGTFSVIIGGGVALFVFREPILNAVTGGETVSPYYAKLAEISGFVGEFWFNLKSAASNVIASANGAVGAYMGVIIMLIVAIVAIQGVLLYRKKR